MYSHNSSLGRSMNSEKSEFLHWGLHTVCLYLSTTYSVLHWMCKELGQGLSSKCTPPYMKTNSISQLLLKRSILHFRLKLRIAWGSGEAALERARTQGSLRNFQQQWGLKEILLEHGNSWQEVGLSFKNETTTTQQKAGKQERAKLAPAQEHPIPALHQPDGAPCSTHHGHRTEGSAQRVASPFSGAQHWGLGTMLICSVDIKSLL